jgi:hypothetical protein
MCCHSLALILLGSTRRINLTEPLGRKTVCFYILQTMSERKATVRGVLTKPRLHSGTVYLCHCGMWIIWTSLKENLRLTFLELLLRIACRFLVVFRIFDFFNNAFHRSFSFGHCLEDVNAYCFRPKGGSVRFIRRYQFLKIARSLAMLCFVHIYKKFVLATVMNGRQPV